MNDAPRPNPIQEIREQLYKPSQQQEFINALPAHIPVERFMRVVITAVADEPKLLQAKRSTLFAAAMKAAQDGLLPDGREGAIVPYWDNKNRVQLAQWIPMIAGIRKKVRNSGEIATWDVHAVFANDEFQYELGDEPRIKHVPKLGERGKIIAVYSIATLKTGEKTRDVMSKEDVDKIAAKSKAKNGPWSDPVFYPEMAKKTVAKRHSKVLPMSTDLDDLMRRDDDLYDMKAASDTGILKDRSGIYDRLDTVAGDANVDMDTGEITDVDVNGDPENDETKEKTKPPAKKAAAKKAPAKKAAAKKKPPEETKAPAEDETDEKAQSGEPESGGTDATEETEEATTGEDTAGDDEGDGSANPYEDSDHSKAWDRGHAAYGKGAPRRMVPPEYRTEGSETLREAWEEGFDEASASDTSE